MTQKLDAPKSANEIRTVYARDILGRLTQKTAAGANHAPQNVAYRYDVLGQLTEATNADARLQWQFDALGNVKTETSLVRGITSTLAHTYDELGNRTALTLPDGRTVNWLYYGSGHLHQVNIADGNEIETLCDVERDQLHREIERSQGALTHRYDYDALGRLVGQSVGQSAAPNATINAAAKARAQSPSARHAMASAIIHRQYRYDRAGHLTEIADNRKGITAYEYDPLGRLTRAQRSASLGGAAHAERFAFDPAHNMVGSSGGGNGGSNTGGSNRTPRSTNAATIPAAQNSTNSNQISKKTDQSAPQVSSAASAATTARSTGFIKNNRLEVFEDKRFAYDVHGNVIEKKIGAHTFQRFAYDTEHQLIAVTTTRGASPNALTQTVRFAYDALGRRVGKSDEFGHTAFVWDGNRLLSETRGAKTRAQVDPEAATVTDHTQTQTQPQPQTHTQTHTRTTLYEPDSFVPMIRLDEITRVDQSGQAQALPAAQNRAHSSQIVVANEASNEASKAANKSIAKGEDDDPFGLRYDLAQDDDYIDPSWLTAQTPEKQRAIAQEFLAELHADTKKRTRAQKQAVEARTSRKRQVLYYQCDHLGTPQELTNASGQIVWSATYAAWGNTLRIETADAADEDFVLPPTES